MRTPLIITFAPFIGLLLFNSCTAYQYATLNSSLPKSQYNDFFFENDTVQIVYSFSGMGCQMTIDIYNKLDKPIYINWDKSSVRIHNSTSPLNSQISSNSYHYSDSYRYTDDDGTSISCTNNVTTSYNDSNTNNKKHIPSHAQHTIYYDLDQFDFLSTINRDSTQRKQLPSDTTEPQFAREKIFSNTSSPLKFTCNISYSDEKDNKQNHSTKHEFWVSSIIKTIDRTTTSSKDSFYNSKTTDFGNFMIGVATVAVITGYVLIKVVEYKAAQE